MKDWGERGSCSESAGLGASVSLVPATGGGGLQFVCEAVECKGTELNATVAIAQKMYPKVCSGKEPTDRRVR